MEKLQPNRLRVLRAERRWTQLTLARKSGVGETRISYIENGLKPPHPDEMVRLAKALKVDIADAFPETVAS